MINYVKPYKVTPVYQNLFFGLRYISSYEIIYENITVYSTPDKPMAEFVCTIMNQAHYVGYADGYGSCTTEKYNPEEVK